MRIWIKRCREPSQETWTLLPYVSDHEISLNTKQRPSVVKNLLKRGCGVYGGCDSVHREVKNMVKGLHGRKLSKSLLTSFQRVCIANLASGSLIFCRSRNYQEIIRWLDYELSRGNASRRDNLSWKQRQRKLGHWYWKQLCMPQLVSDDGWIEKS